MMLDWIQNIYFPQPVLDLLNTGNGIFDFWLVIHLFSGILLFVIYSMFKLKKKTTLLMVISTLIVYEFFESYLFSQGLAIPEPLINQIIDVIVGTAGAYLVLKASSKIK